MNRTFAFLGAVALVALGSATTYVILRREPVPPLSSASHSPAPPPSTAAADVSFALSKEAVERAGIVVGRAVAVSGSGSLRIPAVVEPDAYNSVVVTPIAAGRVTSVSAELGQAVRRGQALAQVYSPELAQVQSGYLASRAELDAHLRELRRTEKLAAIGSASQQELERVHAEHSAATTMVESLRSRLTLLGMTPTQIEKLSSSSEITSTVAITSPIDGVITARSANVGLNVEPSAPLFTVVNLSRVWLVGDLYERDFGRVGIGDSAIVTTTAYPDLRVEGKVSYLDPAIHPQTRTARVRVEVPNPGRQLRFGMYAELLIQDKAAAGDDRQPGGRAVVVPRSAVQIVGDRSVVYLADETQAGRFVERAVKLGTVSGENVVIMSGVQPGDPVVVQGSFSLRAERERLGLRAPAGVSTRITVSEKGFEPSRIAARAGSTLRLSFVRTTDATCATEVSIAALNLTRALPLNEAVEIEITPAREGDIEFACGMDMFRGTIVVE